MNSTIFLRSGSLRSAQATANHVHKSKRSALPPSQHQLASPVRHAILCARQHLLAAEYADGSWLGARPCDTTIAIQLILLQLFCGQELDDRTEDLSRTILRRQLPSGGWTKSDDGQMDDGQIDVDMSIQAYLALKLIGTDAAEMPMSVARTAILNAGGADQGNATTRMILAMFGQIEFDVCPASPPETFLMAKSGEPINFLMLHSLLWSQRVVRSVGSQQGIQELFSTSPKKWNTKGGFAQGALLWMERHGWVPLRRQALDHAEKRLQEWTQESQIAQATLSELIWMTMALHAVGHLDESPPMAACWNTIDERLTHANGDIADNLLEFGTPTDRRHDTAQAIRAVIASGGEPAAERLNSAIEKTLLNEEAIGSTVDDPLAAAVELLALPLVRDGGPDGEGLPPAMNIVEEDDAFFTFGIADCDDPTDRLNLRGDQLAAACHRLQNRDGGWTRNGSDGTSDANTTCRVLLALAGWNNERYQSTITRGIDFLYKAQAANGCWQGINSIQTTSLAVRALRSNGRTVEDPLVTSAINWLVIHQHADGGWRDSSTTDPENCFDESSATCTSLVVTALLDAGQEYSDSTARGIQFLIDSQDNTGSWQESWSTVGGDNQPLNSLTPVCSAIETLSQWAVQCSSEASEPPLFLQLVGAEE